MKRNTIILLILITLFGALARVWLFWKDGFHTDEQFTLNLVKHDFLYIIQWSMTNDCNPPLFYIIDKLSVTAFGFNSFAERLPSVIAGIILIPTVYVFGKELKSETLGLFSALAVSTLGSMWYYSQFGRAYMLECLLFTILCIFYIRVLRGDYQKSNWVMIALISIALAYTHLFSIIPLFFLLAYLIGKIGFESTSITLVAIAVGCSPLMLLFKAIEDTRAMSREVGSSVWHWYGVTAPQIIIFAPLEFFSYNFMFWIPMIVYSMWRNYKRMPEIIVIVGAFIGSFIALLALSDTTPVFIRYTLLFVPVLLSIGLIPVAEFADSHWVMRIQKVFVIGSFAVFYFAIVIFAFWSGLYIPKDAVF